jgi:hypothetical protein
MNWRKWIFEELSGDPDLLKVVDLDHIFGSGSIHGNPVGRPFIVIQMGIVGAQLPDDAAVSTECTLWCHDEPGDYSRLDTIICLARIILCGQVREEGGIEAIWNGDSGDLADDGYGTIVKTSGYRLLGTGG